MNDQNKCTHCQSDTCANCEGGVCQCTHGQTEAPSTEAPATDAPAEEEETPEVAS